MAQIAKQTQGSARRRQIPCSGFQWRMSSFRIVELGAVTTYSQPVFSLFHAQNLFDAVNYWSDVVAASKAP